MPPGAMCPFSDGLPGVMMDCIGWSSRPDSVYSCMWHLEGVFCLFGQSIRSLQEDKHQ